MSYGWENHEPAPLEYFHGKLMDYFHELRCSKVDQHERYVSVDGIEINNIIAKAKIETYKKYPKQVSNNPILKSEL
jgi:hypothetical protein